MATPECRHSRYTRSAPEGAGNDPADAAIAARDLRNRLFTHNDAERKIGA